MPGFSKILIANRGEIAIRVARTARQLGYRTVAVYSEADRGEPHVEIADQAVPIGPSPPRDSYLSIPRLLEAAARSGADAVHPGYGFLAEDADFAEACRDQGLIFIGPDPSVIRLMGHKTRAKARMLQAGVPCVSGSMAGGTDPAELRAIAQEVGYPLLVKAAAGGGGRGMRQVDDPRDLEAALEAARSEAEGAFGSSEVFLERQISGARHVEMQIFGDRNGNAVHLGERDCSIQRRHQKVIEESPSPALDEDLRRNMGQAAVEAAKAIGYVGAGTVEFLLDDSGEFYFLEMNTRLQVEHPVTEARTGLDLVAWQLRVATGEALFRQEEVAPTGHAMEARLYAEDPAAGFLPQTGTVHLWRPPAAGDARIDAGIRTGSVVSPFYDPMVAKFVTWGESREVARRRLILALEDSVLLGPRTNKAFLLQALRHPEFEAGRANTTFVETHFPAHRLKPSPPPHHVLALAAILLSEGPDALEESSLWGWRSSGQATWELSLAWEEEERRIELELQGNRTYRVQVEGESLAIEIVEKGGGTVRFLAAGVQDRVPFHCSGDEVFVEWQGTSQVFRHRIAVGGPSAAPDAGCLVAPMSARVVAVHTTPGARVEAGECLLVLEAMKLESRVVADGAGQVEKVLVAEGDQVTHRQLLAVLALEEPQSDTRSEG